jgi:hypothetical protein
MAKGYILLKKGWEYDDETYSETEGGKPVKIYLDKSKADEDKLNFEVKKFHNLDLYIYYYTLDEILKEGVNLNQLESYLLANWPGIDLDVLSLPRSVTKEQIKGLMELITVEFFELVETEIED